jgi:hypothetical protein
MLLAGIWLKRYSPVSPPLIYFCFISKRIGSSHIGTAAHSFLMINVSALLQLAPLLNRNATDYRRLISIMGLSPLRGSLRAAPVNRDGSIIIPNFSSWRAAAPHGCFCLSADRSLRIRRKHLGRSWRQKTGRFEKRGKIRSTETIQFSRYKMKWSYQTLHFYNGHF